MLDSDPPSQFLNTIVDLTEPDGPEKLAGVSAFTDYQTLPDQKPDCCDPVVLLDLQSDDAFSISNLLVRKNA